MAAEILVVTPAIRALIRDDKIHQIYSLMQSGKKYGMQTLNDALYQLYMSREVTRSTSACACRSDPNEFLRMIGQSPRGRRRSKPDGSDGQRGRRAGRREPHARTAGRRSHVAIRQLT